MPAGKIAVSGGVGPLLYLPYGVSINSMRPRYAKQGVNPPDCQEIQHLRRYLRDTFKLYALDCRRSPPTATERRQALRRIKAAAERVVSMPNSATAGHLLTALETPDLDARKLVYRPLTAAGHNPLQFKRRLRHWTIASPADHDVIGSAMVLANLDVEALVPVGGRFPDPSLAHLVTSLIPIWTKITGRTAGLIKADLVGDAKECPFADWLGEMHDLLGAARPPLGRVIDIVRIQR
jgi:hypothetical protein